MIDMKALAASKYRLALDESEEVGGQTWVDRTWLYIIPCKYGHIYIHGENLLGAYAEGTRIANRLARLEEVRVHQRGDREITVVFPPEHLDRVALLMGARRRRQLTPEDRARRAERMKRIRARVTVEAEPELTN